MMKNLHSLLSFREYSNNYKYEELLQESIHKIFLETLHQKSIPTLCNKIYCSHWITDDLIVYATKDKLLNLYNCRNNKTTLIKDYRTDEEKNNHEKIAISTGIKSLDYKNNKLIIAINNNIDMYNLNQFDKFDKINTFKSHTDWISKIQWVNGGSNILTSSKDQTVKIWNGYGVNTNIYEYEKYDNYCRDFKFDKFNNKLYCLSSNGVVNFFDVTKRKKYYKIKLKNQECVVSEYNYLKKLFVVGTKDSVILLDTRTKKKSLEIPNMNGNTGTRSLGWYNDNVLSIGGGTNKLSFYDIRKNSGFIKNDNKNFYNIDKGFIKNDSTYQMVLNSQVSIYTHTYNSNKNKIFVAGGPTMIGLFGSQMSILQ